MVAAVLVVLDAPSASAGEETGGDKIAVCHWSEDGYKFIEPADDSGEPRGHGPDTHPKDVILGPAGDFTEADCEKPTLTLVKTVDGGTATQDDFTPTIGGSNSTWGTHTYEHGDGPFTIGESATATDYSLDSIVCTGGSASGDSTGTLTVGDDVVCTITNTFSPAEPGDPTLTVTKTVDNTAGGTAVVGDFTLTVTPDGGSGVNVTSGASNTFASGDYTVSESSLEGYVAGDWGGDCAADGSITMVADTDYECTITNTFEAVAGPEEPTEPTTPTTIVAGGSLPNTGGSADLLVLFIGGLGLMLLGAGLFLMAPRRRLIA